MPLLDHSSPSTDRRRRPAFEKLLIGPAMAFGEAVAGGHYLEVLCLEKQMATGRVAPSYREIHRALVAASGGLRPALYRGFHPWGLLQTVRGVPVLFCQHESLYHLRRLGLSPSTAGDVSGIIGGVAQAVFVTPLQKLKVSVVARDDLHALSPARALRAVFQRDGPAGLFHGLVPTALRGALDWGIRFGVSLRVRDYLLEEKRCGCHPLPAELTPLEWMGCGFAGGAASALTQPLDNVATNCQKPLPPGASRGVAAVVARMYHEGGIRAFTRSMGLTVLDNAWHMAWMFGVGNIVYAWMEEAMSSPGRGSPQTRTLDAHTTHRLSPMTGRYNID